MKSTLKDPKLLSYLQRFDKAEQLFATLIDGVTDDDAFNWSPNVQSWSIAMCIEHLNITANLNIKCMRPAIELAIRNNWTTSEKTYRRPIGGRIILMGLHSKRGWKLKAPAIFVPSSKRYSKDAVVTEFQSIQKTFRELLQKSDGLHLTRMRFRIPVSRFIRVNLDQAFDIQPTHQLRHLEQARRV